MDGIIEKSIKKIITVNALRGLDTPYIFPISL